LLEEIIHHSKKLSADFSCSIYKVDLFVILFQDETADEKQQRVEVMPIPPNRFYSFRTPAMPLSIEFLRQLPENILRMMLSGILLSLVFKNHTFCSFLKNLLR
jgi:hypothetical protein